MKKTVLGLALAVALAASGGTTADEDVAKLSELLSIPSVSADVPECDRAVEWMRSYLEANGVWCRVFTVPEAGGRKVLYAATKPELKNPERMMVTHLDVVAAPPEQFSPRLEGGRLYARGACDTKANAFCGAKVLIALNGKVSAGCIFASNEEIGGSTTKAVLDNGYGLPKKALLVLDAASRAGNIGYACMGCAYYKVTAQGISGHASTPERCENPIYILAEAALKLRDNYPKRNPDEWKNCVAVTIIGGGDSQNRVPETASMTVNVRFTEENGLETERALIEKITGLKTELIRGTPAACGDPDAPEYTRIRTLTKKHYPDRPCLPSKGRGANDMRWFGAFKGAIASVTMNLDGGHSANEWCEVSDIGNYIALLTEILAD